MTIRRFSLSHDEFQSADRPLYLVFSTREFELPPDRVESPYEGFDDDFTPLRAGRGLVLEPTAGSSTTA